MIPVERWVARHDPLMAYSDSSLVPFIGVAPTESCSLSLLVISVSILIHNSFRPERNFILEKSRPRFGRRSELHGFTRTPMCLRNLSSSHRHCCSVEARFIVIINKCSISLWISRVLSIRIYGRRNFPSLTWAGAEISCIQLQFWPSRFQSCIIKIFLTNSCLT